MAQSAKAKEVAVEYLTVAQQPKMSRGRGGRGRGGRGGRGGGGNSTFDLVRDNLEDMGMEYGMLQGNNDPAPLFPTITLPEPLSSLSEDQQFKVQKMREISFRLQASPFHIKTRRDSNKESTRVNVIDFVKSHVMNYEQYIPTELVEGTAGEKRAAKSKKRQADISLSHLEHQEGKGKKEEEKKDSEDELEEEVVEEEFEDDYGVNHYESDDGFGSDGDAEATFD